MPHDLLLYLVTFLWIGSMISTFIAYEHYVTHPGPITPLKRWWINLSTLAFLYLFLAFANVLPQ